MAIMNETITVGIVQHACVEDRRANLDASVAGIREAAGQGATLVLLQELHTGVYFCQTEDTRRFDQAEPIPGPTTEELGTLARELGIVIVASLFERRAAGLYHNTAVVLERDGEIAGRYRKMHIPDDPGYYEKFYFTPGDLGFTPIATSVGMLGVLVCWDQWYPEAARLMMAWRTACQWWSRIVSARNPTPRGNPPGSHSGDRVSFAGRKERSSRAQCPIGRKCWSRKSAASAPRTCAGSGRSCATGASTPMPTCSNATASDHALGFLSLHADPLAG